MNKAKTLVVVAHPDLAASTINKRWVDELEKHRDDFTVHQLYQRYPDGKIDVPGEQRLVDAHQHLVLQFPVYWFNCPPLLKQWFDDVLTYGWAYGSKGNSLKNKKTGIAVSLGAPAADYSESGNVGFTVAQALRAFELTMRYVQSDYQPIFTFHGIDSNAGYDDAARQKVEQSAADYLAHLHKYYA